MSGSRHALGEISYTQLQAHLQQAKRAVALLPAGSVEAHGPHLPLSTDTMIAQAVAELAASKLAAGGCLAVCYPPLHYGVADWATGFAGTTSIAAHALRDTALQACVSAHKLGFGQVVVTNAHLEPGHIATLRDVAVRFEQATRTPLLFVDKTRRAQAAKLGAEFQSGSCHAGQYETSLMLAIRPELVDRAAAAQLPPVVEPLHEHIRAGARTFADCGLTQAYCGTPAQATVAEGEALLEVLASMVLDAVEAAYHQREGA